MVCLSQLLMSQTLQVLKTDNTTIDYKLSDVDSIKFSTSPSGALISASDWICFTNNLVLSKVELSSGTYEEVEAGLKVYGSSDNTTVQIMPASQSAAATKTIYLKWKANGNGRPVNVSVELFGEKTNLTSLCKAFSLSTNAGIISDDTWYYTRISIASGIITSVTSKDNYDDNGGKTVASSSSVINKDIKTFSFQTNTDKSSYSILAETRIE